MNAQALEGRLAEALQQAWQRYQREDFPGAVELCERVLTDGPPSFDATLLRGVLHARIGQLAAAEARFAQAIALRPSDPTAHLNRGAALRAMGQLDAALESYDRALALEPNSPEAHFNRGNLLQQLGRLADAVQSFTAALTHRPEHFAAHFNRGNALLALGQAEAAADSYQRALQLRPQFAEAHLNLGNALRAQQRLEAALASYERALALQPQSAEASLNTAITLIELERPETALPYCLRALEAWPASAEAHQAYGLALQALQRPQEALVHHRRALEIDSTHFRACYSLANTLYRLDDLRAARIYFEQALRLDPEHPDPYMRLGDMHLDLGEPELALARYDQALQHRSDHAEAYGHRGIALYELQRLEAAEQSFAAALRLNPRMPDLAAMALHLRTQLGQWQNYESARHALLEAFSSQALKRIPPFPVLALTDSPALQRQAAEQWPRELDRRSPEQIQRTTVHNFRHSRLRIGYLSGDFREHPVAYLIAGLIERHDRSRFEIFALSLRPAALSPYGARIGSAVDHFIDLSSCSDRETAERIRALEIDILIDLVGNTQGFRSTLLWRRPAPLQINYLGYPGTLGAPYIDYLIADAYLIPEAQRAHYAEQLIYLPECFQANDDRRAHPEPTARSELGLPEQAVVLCCFNNSYKLNPSFFEVWMRLLAARSDAVLWLVAALPIVEQNLRREAAARGIDPSRLHFAPRLPYEQHLARLAAADLFLDTLPFNGGTTVSDALWMGVPVLTCSGQAFAARMGGSLLTAMGLPELITTDLVHYEQRALELLEQPQRLAALRGKLLQARSTSPLFDTTRFTRHFEAALIAIQERLERGLPTEHLSVS